MQQLSGLDAGFLSLETDTAPMSIGGLSILDPSGPDGRLDVDRLRHLLRDRLATTVAFRRRLASTPFDLTRPYWVELPPDQVDLEAHVKRTELPAPGGWHELAELMAWEQALPLPRDRPLWEILLVEGLRTVDGAPDDAVALIGRVHHAAIDGVSGAEILGALFDGRGPAPERTGLSPVTEPAALELLGRAGREIGKTSLAIPGIVGRSLLGLAGTAASRLRSGSAPPLPFTAPKTCFNRPISRQRSWAPVFFGLDRVKAIKNTAGATVNDVILAVCAGGLRGWLDERSELPKRPLVAMVPVSVRGRDERHDAGNLVSAMLVSLATDEPDPMRRFLRIRDAARSSKLAHQAIGARTLVESTDLVPFALSGLAARLYTRLHLADQHRPPFNLVITNVPGPPRPLSIAGAPLLAHAGAAPLFDGLGLLLPVFSYAGTLSVGVTADRAIVPDAMDLAARIGGALDELEGAVGGG